MAPGVGVEARRECNRMHSRRGNEYSRCPAMRDAKHSQNHLSLAHGRELMTNLIETSDVMKKPPSKDGDFVMAPGVGIEPTTKGLTVLCSTAELPRNMYVLNSEADR